MTLQKTQKLVVSVLFLLILSISAQAKTYYFSSHHGVDLRTSEQAQNPDSPWKTLKKLNSFMTNILPGDSILFKRGEVFDGAIVIENSGSSLRPILIGAYGEGADPIINGFSNLSSWADLGEKIFETSCSTCPSDLNLVLVNGVPQPMGRFPNTGYLKYDSHDNNSSITDYHLSGVTNWTGAEVVIRKNRWIIDRSTITSHTNNNIHYAAGTNDLPKDNFGYFIQNDSRTLDEEGEWYFNGDNKKLRILFGNDAPGLAEVQASTIETLLLIIDSNSILIENISFQGANSSAIDIRTSKSITIRNCSFNYSGSDAIAVNWSPNITIENSHINHSLNNAITLDAGCTQAIVKNNTVKNTGLLPGMGKSGSGTYQAIASFGKEAMIEYNRIDSIGYNAIYFGGDLSEVKNNLIQNFCLTKDDGGGIYVGDWFESYGKKINGNIVLNGKGNGEGTDDKYYFNAHGIYIDELSKGVEIMNNTVANCKDTGITIHNAQGINIQNNTLYNNATQINLNQDRKTSDYLIRDISLKHNVFVSKEVSQPTAAYFSIQNDIYDFGESDNNFFIRPLDNEISITSVHQEANKKIWKAYTLKDWQSDSNMDRNSYSSPKTVSPYSIEKLQGENKVPNGNFDSYPFNVFVNSENANAELSWQDSDKIEGNSLKIGFTKPSETSNLVTVGIANIGSLDSLKHYQLKFTVADSSTNRYLGIYLQQDTAPFQKLTPVKYILLTSPQETKEVLFSNPKTIANANIIFQLSDTDGAIYFDSLSLHQADVQITDPEDHIKFIYNASNSARTVTLDQSYIDSKNNTFQNDIILQPWSSAVLFTKDEKKKPQLITFPSIPDGNYEEGKLELKASASSALPIKFRVVSGPATLSGSKVSITAPDVITIEASQVGNAIYQAAPPVARSFHVIKGSAIQSNEEVLYRINSGGRSFTFEDEDWITDDFYDGGRVFQKSNVSISNTENNFLYLSERFGDFSYRLPVPESGIYKVELHFAEIYWQKTGSRIFDFKIENEKYKMEHLDIHKESGSPLSSIIYSAEGIAVHDGFLDIELKSRKDNAKVSGIVLYKTRSSYDSKTIQSRMLYPTEEIRFNKSKIISKEMEKVTLYPNPAKEKFSLDFYANETDEWSFTLFDSKGVSVFKENRALEVGRHRLEFQLLAYYLSPGTYYFNISNKRNLHKMMSLVLL